MTNRSNAYNQRILIVEDYDPFRESIAAILRNAHYQVDEAATGAAALEKLEQEHYGAIVLDLILSNSADEMQGLDLLAHLKARGCNTPVIVVSNKASDEVFSKTVKFGVFKFLLKTLVNEDLLKSTVAKALEYGSIVGQLSSHLVRAGDYQIIRGLTSDMHHVVEQYIGYFKAYAADFKGARVETKIITGFDDIIITFDSEAEQASVFEWFREFIGYAERTGDILPTLERFVSPEEMNRSTARLRDQVRKFSNGIAAIFSSTWREPFHLPEPEAELVIFEISPIKIFNNVLLKKSATVNHKMAVAVQSVVQVIEKKVVDKNTLGALETLVRFCSEHGLKKMRGEAILLQTRLNRALDEWNRGEITKAQYTEELNQIHVALILGLLLDLSQLYR